VAPVRGVFVCHLFRAFPFTDLRTCRAMARRTLATPEGYP
jgi:hypothetical protein